MSWVTILVLLAATAPVRASRENDTETKADTRISVGARSFQLSASEHQDSEQAKAGAKTKLQELARERERVHQKADDLERQMREQYAHLLGGEVDKFAEKTASLLSVGEHDTDAGKLQEREDQQFDELEQQTNNIMQWFQELKQLKQARDKMRAQKYTAVKAAQGLGMSPAEVQKELAGTVSSEADKEAQQRQHLADVMASSALEMAQIESTAADVMSGLEDLKKWKERADYSPASLAEASKVKSKLDKSLNYLQEHEGIVNERTDQINTLMKQANLGQL